MSLLFFIVPLLAAILFAGHYLLMGYLEGLDKKNEENKKKNDQSDSE